MLKAIRLHIAESTYDSLRLRFYLYPGGIPSPTARPLHSWRVDTDRSAGWITVDALADELMLTGDVFVSVEILEAWPERSNNRLLLSAGLFTDGLYHRERHVGEWEQAGAGLALSVVTLR